MQRMIEFLPLYLQGWLKLITYWWPVLLFATIQIIRLWRWEQIEKKRLARAVQRNRLKKLTNGRYQDTDIEEV